MPVSASATVLGTLGIAVLLVAVDPLWKRTGQIVTLFHEGGHMVSALLTGNWIKGFVVARDASGVTVLGKSKLFWPSDVIVTLAGYSAPPVAGLLLARGVEVGWNAETTLAVLLLLLVGGALFHEGWFTLILIVAVGLLLGLFVYRAGPGAQLGAVLAFSWFLLLGGLRDTFEIAVRPAPRFSDQHQLQQLTAIPARLWTYFFLFIAIAALVTAARWLLY